MESVPARTRLLLAEEDPIQRLMIREYLELFPQYEVQEANGTFHILATCESSLSRIGLILLDMEWSRVDGVDLILEIRRRNPALPILGMTDRPADLYEDVRLRGMTRVGFVPKPFSSNHLQRSIKAVLSAARMHSLEKTLGRGTSRDKGTLSILERSSYGHNPA